MRPAICVVVAAAALCAGCYGTEVAEKPKRHSGCVLTIVPPRKLVYVIDRSGSMTDLIDYVKFKLNRSIAELNEEEHEFHVIFYSSGPPVEMPTRRLVRATRHNKALAGEFIDGIVPQGETDPVESIKRAFAVRPDVIYLLTDDEFDRSVVDLVKRLNADKRVKVNTISFLYGPHAVLKEMAEQTGGTYTFVSEADLEAMFPG